MKGYDQRVSNPDNWLTHLFGEDETQRQFVKVIHLLIGQSWDEVSNEYYEEWKEKYQPEPETVESVEQPTE